MQYISSSSIGSSNLVTDVWYGHGSLFDLASSKKTNNTGKTCRVLYSTATNTHASLPTMYSDYTKDTYRYVRLASDKNNSTTTNARQKIKFGTENYVTYSKFALSTVDIANNSTFSYSGTLIAVMLLS